MRDFPIFTTEYGVSNLILREIPYRNEAYIRILDVQPGKLVEHLKECVAFCRMAGAERIYAAGDVPEECTVFTTLVEMRGRIEPGEEDAACLFPVTEQTAARWRSLYNQAMARVDTARTLEARDERKLAQEAGAYFVHEGGKLLGIGWLQDNRLMAVASVCPGSGERILKTLAPLLEGEDLVLDVASTNERAIRLYERMGLLRTREVDRWYDCSSFR